MLKCIIFLGKAVYLLKWVGNLLRSLSNIMMMMTLYDISTILVMRNEIKL